ncbi:MAG: hypothetical protein IKL96_06745 [Kiritimatiellae bacterium]|nr:hypothetical protein [Kiritimatiellia bacterium]
MKKLIAMAAIAAVALAVIAAEHNTPQTSGDYAKLTAGEAVYAGNIAGVWTNGLAYAVNSATPASGTLTVCGVFLHSAAKGENVTVQRGGFILENATGAGAIAKKDIGATAYSVAANPWTVTKTSGTKTVGKVADVRDDRKVVVVVGR